MSQRHLSEIADIVRGIAFPKEDKSLVQRPGDVACLRTTNVQKHVEWGDLWFVPAKHVKRNDQNVCSGDILISTANTRNRAECSSLAFRISTTSKRSSALSAGSQMGWTYPSAKLFRCGKIVFAALRLAPLSVTQGSRVFKLQHGSRRRSVV